MLRSYSIAQLMQLRTCLLSIGLPSTPGDATPATLTLTLLDLHHRSTSTLKLLLMGTISQMLVPPLYPCDSTSGIKLVSAG